MQEKPRILFFLITLCIFVTGSKGAIVGFAASVLSFLMLVLFYFAQIGSEKTRRAIRLSAFTTLTVCGLFVGYMSFGRLDSLRFRICTWVSTSSTRLTRRISTNAIRHARASYVEMELHYTASSIVLRVVDDGRGFDLEHPEENLEDHLGLASMQERTHLIGGRFHVATAVGQGTTIEAAAPVE